MLFLIVLLSHIIICVPYYTPPPFQSNKSKKRTKKKKKEQKQSKAKQNKTKTNKKQCRGCPSGYVTLILTIRLQLVKSSTPGSLFKFKKYIDFFRGVHETASPSTLLELSSSKKSNHDIDIKQIITMTIKG